jgi:MoxR-like ATPase
VLVAERFRDPSDVRDRLRAADYLADEAVAVALFLADRLDRPLLVEGPAGVGKTELAKATAAAVGARLIRLQCYEGLDESRALYEWNYRKQLLRIQASPASSGIGEPGWSAVEESIFDESFLLPRPLLEAIRAKDDVVLLIDEVDRLEVETEALLLEVLAEFQVTIPELGTVRAARRPLVILTSNSTRELGEALRRRCLFVPLDYPLPAREAEIIRVRAPGVDEHLADDVARFLQAARRLDLRKRPSISEAIDWARALAALGKLTITDDAVATTLPVLFKTRSDMETASRHFLSAGAVAEATTPTPEPR